MPNSGQNQVVSANDFPSRQALQKECLWTRDHFFDRAGQANALGLLTDDDKREIQTTLKRLPLESTLAFHPRASLARLVSLHRPILLECMELAAEFDDRIASVAPHKVEDTLTRSPTPSSKRARSGLKVERFSQDIYRTVDDVDVMSVEDEAASGLLVPFGTPIPRADPERFSDKSRMRAIIAGALTAGDWTLTSVLASLHASKNGDDSLAEHPILEQLCRFPPPSRTWLHTLTRQALYHWKKRVGTAAAGTSPKSYIELLEHGAKGKPPAEKSHELDAAILNAFRDNPLLSAAGVTLVLRERGLTELGERRIQQIVKKRIPTQALIEAIHGKSAARGAFQKTLLREAKSSNQVWQMDHCQENFALNDPVVPLPLVIRSDDGERRQVYCTVILDDCGREVMMCRLLLEPPTTESTMLAFRDAVLLRGLPEYLYTDNGADLVAHAFLDALNVVGVVPVHSRPGEPQGRGKVERFNRTLKEKILPLLRGHLGGPKPRHWHLDELGTLEETQTRLDDLILRYYSTKKGKQDKQSPAARYAARATARCEPGFLRDEDMLALMPHMTRVVRRAGIEIFGRTYWGAGLERVHVNSTVTVFFSRKGDRVIEVATGPDIAPMRYLGKAACDGMPDPKRQRALGNAVVSATPRSSSAVESPRRIAATTQPVAVAATSIYRHPMRDA